MIELTDRNTGENVLINKYTIEAVWNEGEFGSMIWLGRGSIVIAKESYEQVKQLIKDYEKTK